MKSFRPLFCILLFAVAISACKSEEEKRMARMIDSLDSCWTIHESGINAFFASADAMKAAMKPEKVYGPGEDSLLPGEAGQVWAEVGSRPFGRVVTGKAGKLQTTEDLLLGTNAFPIMYDDSLWNKSSNWFFKTWRYLPDMHLNHLYERRETEKWSNLFYEERHTGINGEDRDDFLRMGLQMIPFLKDIHHLLVIQPVLFLPGKVAEDGFESGSTLAKVHVWDVGAKQFTGYFWVKASNSFSVFTVRYGEESEKDAMEDELVDDLKNNLFKELADDIDEVIAGAKKAIKVWD
jgi:hypothetical protein